MNAALREQRSEIRGVLWLRSQATSDCKLTQSEKDMRTSPFPGVSLRELLGKESLAEEPSSEWPPSRAKPGATIEVDVAVRVSFLVIRIMSAMNAVIRQLMEVPESLGAAVDGKEKTLPYQSGLPTYKK
ncbi:uncharacterized protein FOMMEDRAFT_153765 [Fomitiporia mediterranea MF3/22]|uniref:uncharacterized protein n=1 Tax=Fomitiporia mediterranea (strain MF3/22) TaxID=694068 RepID=UPI00044084CA|nr:uncharacterized protein FOMMEDRAFT_153765 [Fomitiporia mediterranea MF3/22]EJD04696.1 hypothetical protein FOMMEDRAFT_153765 [Fomitiporia mediterranea MF3/22]